MWLKTNKPFYDLTMDAKGDPQKGAEDADPMI